MTSKAPEMDIPANPLLAKATISADRDRIPVSTSSDRPQPSSATKPPAAIRALVAKLGLRYRPSAQADLEAHAGAIALLAQDLADIPPDLLDRAIREHIMSSPYMPKASDLIAKARSYIPQPGKRDQYAIAEMGNAGLEKSGRRDVHWIVEDGKAVMAWR